MLLLLIGDFGTSRWQLYFKAISFPRRRKGRADDLVQCMSPLMAKADMDSALPISTLGQKLPFRTDANVK